MFTTNYVAGKRRRGANKQVSLFLRRRRERKGKGTFFYYLHSDDDKKVFARSQLPRGDADDVRGKKSLLSSFPIWGNLHNFVDHASAEGKENPLK